VAFDAGSIESKLTLDRTPFQRDLELARREVEDFERRGVNVGVRLNLRQFDADRAYIDAKLLEMGRRTVTTSVRVDTNGIDQAARRAEQDINRIPTAVNQAAQRSNAQFSLMRTLIEQLGPAIVPLAGGLAGLSTAAIGFGAAGILAVKGVTAEMKAGTLVGAAYGGQIGVLKNILGQLESQVTKTTLPYFRQEVMQIQAAVPGLNGMLNSSGRSLGQATSAALGGTLALLKDFSPLIKEAEGYVVALAQHFEAWAQGPGGPKLMQTLKTDMEAVVPLLQNLWHLTTNLLSGLNSTGLGTVRMLTGLVGVLSQLSPTELQAMTTAYIAFRAATMVSTGIKSATLALDQFAIAQRGATVASAEGAAASRAGGGFMGGMVTGTRTVLGGLAKILPFYALASIGLNSAATATDRWTQSTNQLANVSSNFAGVLRSIVNFDPSGVVQSFHNVFAGAQANRDASQWNALIGQRMGTAAPTAQTYSYVQGQRVNNPTSTNYNVSPQDIRNYQAINAAQAQMANSQRAQTAIVSQLNTQQSQLNKATMQYHAALRDGSEGQILAARSKMLILQHQMNVTGQQYNKVLIDQKNLQHQIASDPRYNLTKAALSQQTLATQTAHQYVSGVNDRNAVGLGYAVNMANSYSGLSTSLDGYIKQVTNAQTHEKQWQGILDQSGMKINDTVVATKKWDVVIASTNGNVGKAMGIIRGHVAAVNSDQTAIGKAQLEQNRVNSAVAAAATRFKITTDQVQLYGYALGITGKQLATGAVSQRNFLFEVGQTKHFLDNGSTAVQAYSAAVAQYAQSNKTVSDTAALMAQTMQSLNGDMIQYSNSMAGAAGANQQFVKDVENGARTTSQSNKGFLTSIINLRKGTIDYHNAAAAPLLNDLQSIQSASAAAAAATYQHEKSQHMGAQAAKDAADVYRNDTITALEAEAHQLGLTQPQADKLAQTYFHWPKNAKTLISQFGGNSVQTLLGKILTQLEVMNGMKVRPLINDNGLTQAQTKADRLLVTLGQINKSGHGGGGRAGLGYNVPQAAAGSTHMPRGVLPSGYATVGERGWELVHTSPRGTSVVDHKTSMSITGLPDHLPGFSGGTGEHGGVTVNYNLHHGGSGGSRGSGGGSGSSSSGHHRHGPIDDVVQVLRGAGYNNVAIAGILGNASEESGLQQYRRQSTPSGTSNPLIVDGNTGWGLWQWTSRNYQQDLMNRYGRYATARQQAQYLVGLIGGLRGTLNSSPDAATAAARFMNGFEHPKMSVANLPAREQAASSIINQLTAGSSLGGVGSSSGPTGAQKALQNYQQNHIYTVNGYQYHGLQSANQQRALLQSRGNTARVVKVGSGGNAAWGFNGQGYGTSYEAHNAMVQYDRQRGRTLEQVESQSKGELAGIQFARGRRRMSDDSAASIDARMAKIQASLQKANQYHLVPEQLVTRFSKDTKQLNTDLAYRDKWLTKLRSWQQRYRQDQQAANQYQSSLRQSYMADITSVGNGYAYGIQASINQQTANSTKYKSLFDRAKKMGLEPRIVTQFINQPGGMANLEAIVNAGQGYISGLNKSYDQMYAASDAIAKEGTQGQYGKTLANDRKQIRDAMNNYNHGLSEVRGDLKTIAGIVEQMRRDIKAQDEKKRKHRGNGGWHQG
jgi:hypothetical protein